MFNWKEMANVRAKKISDAVRLHKCSETKKEIYYKAKDKIFPFQSFGKCDECKKDFHYSALKMAEGLGHDEWPIHYFGYLCRTCYYKEEEIEPQLKIKPISDE